MSLGICFCIFAACLFCMESVPSLSAKLKEISRPKRSLPELCENTDSLNLFKNRQYNAAFPSCPEFGECRKVDFYFGDRIGRGRYGEVVKGMHLETGTVVAIKKLSGDGLKAASIRSEECSQHMVDLSFIRRHYCTISDLENKMVYLVMEYLEGTPLSEVVKEPTETPLETIRRWTASLAIAIHALHLQGLTYCDLKLENIIRTTDGSVKLIDLGLVRKSYSCTLGLAFPAGTPIMWPPEYLPIDSQKCYSNPSADWWAFAMTLFMLWTRVETPYNTDSLKPYEPKGRQDKEGFKMYMSKFRDLILKGFPIPNKYLLESPELGDFIIMMTEIDPIMRIGASEENILEVLFAHPWLTPLDLFDNPLI